MDVRRRDGHQRPSIPIYHKASSSARRQNIELEKEEIDALFSVDLLHASPSLAMLESDDDESISIGEAAKCAFLRV